MGRLINKLRNKMFCDISTISKKFMNDLFMSSIRCEIKFKARSIVRGRTINSNNDLRHIKDTVAWKIYCEKIKS